MKSWSSTIKDKWIVSGAITKFGDEELDKHIYITRKADYQPLPADSIITTPSIALNMDEVDLLIGSLHMVKRMLDSVDVPD